MCNCLPWVPPLPPVGRGWRWAAPGADPVAGRGTDRLADLGAPPPSPSPTGREGSAGSACAARYCLPLKVRNATVWHGDDTAVAAGSSRAMLVLAKRMPSAPSLPLVGRGRGWGAAAARHGTPLPLPPPQRGEGSAGSACDERYCLPRNARNATVWQSDGVGVAAPSSLEMLVLAKRMPSAPPLPRVGKGWGWGAPDDCWRAPHPLPPPQRGEGSALACKVMR